MKSIWTMGEMIVEIMRVEPEVPHSKIGIYQGPYASGAPAIMISAAARVGVPTGIIGGVGQDGFGQVLMERLDQCGVDCSLVNRSEKDATGCAFVMYHDDGSREYLFHIDQMAATDVNTPCLDSISNPGYFHVMGCSLTVNYDFCQKIVHTALDFAKRGGKISFDPNIRPELLKSSNFREIVNPILEKCAVLMPGVSELLMLSGCSTVEKAVERLFADCSALELITLKNGSKGCSIYSRNGVIHAPAYPIQEVDATGAGDCFDGVFLASLLKGKSLIDSACCANAAGALNAAAFGPLEGDISNASIDAMIAR